MMYHVGWEKSGDDGGVYLHRLTHVSVNNNFNLK